MSLLGFLGGVFRNRSERKQNQANNAYDWKVRQHVWRREDQANERNRRNFLTDRTTQWAREDQIRNRQEYLNSPKGIREEAEAAGINPQWLLGGAGGYGGSIGTSAPVDAGATAQAGGYVPNSQPAPYSIGQAISDAALAYADRSHVEQSLAIQRARLEMQNFELTDRLKRASLRPREGGIYEHESDPRTGQLHSPTDSRTTDSPFHQRSKEDRKKPVRDQYNLYVDVYDSEANRWITIPNPDLMEMGPAELAASQAMLGAADIAQNGQDVVAQTPKGKERLQRLREYFNRPSRSPTLSPFNRPSRSPTLKPKRTSNQQYYKKHRHSTYSNAYSPFN